MESCFATQRQCDLGVSDLTSVPPFLHLPHRGDGNTSVTGSMEHSTEHGLDGPTVSGPGRELSSASCHYYYTHERTHRRADAVIAEALPSGGDGTKVAVSACVSVCLLQGVVLMHVRARTRTLPSQPAAGPFSALASRCINRASTLCARACTLSLGKASEINTRWVFRHRTPSPEQPAASQPSGAGRGGHRDWVHRD